MRIARGGLQLHDTVRDAIARELHSSDPQRYLTLRRACWSRLTRELRTASRAELWRYTADLLYLLENPVVREAFFPSGAQRYAVEPARPADEAEVLAIAERHDGPVAAHATAVWWKHRLDSFGIARDRNADVAGYYVLFEAAGLGTTPVLDDPVVAQRRRTSPPTRSPLANGSSSYVAGSRVPTAKHPARFKLRAGSI